MRKKALNLSANTSETQNLTNDLKISLNETILLSAILQGLICDSISLYSRKRKSWHGASNSKIYALKIAEGRFRSFFEPGYDTIVQQIMHTNASSMKNKYGEDFIQS